VIVSQFFHYYFFEQILQLEKQTLEMGGWTWQQFDYYFMNGWLITELRYFLVFVIYIFCFKIVLMNLIELYLDRFFLVFDIWKKCDSNTRL